MEIQRFNINIFMKIILDLIPVTMIPIHEGGSIESNSMLCGLCDVLLYYLFYFIFRIPSCTV